MSVRTFYLGLIAAFALPWVFLVALPYGELTASDVTVVDDAFGITYPQTQAGFIEYGHRVYASEGCAQCHTQMIRPTYAGPDVWRWTNLNDGSSRETRPEDYVSEKYAFLGVQRIGPDLSNLGVITPQEEKEGMTDAIARQQHLVHLYDPRSINIWSNMPSYQNLFEKRRITGGQSDDALVNVPGLEEGYEVVPTMRAKALVTYLMSMKKDVPTAPVQEEPKEEKKSDDKATDEKAA